MNKKLYRIKYEQCFEGNDEYVSDTDTFVGPGCILPALAQVKPKLLRQALNGRKCIDVRFLSIDVVSEITLK